MNINAVYTDKSSSAVLTLSFEASCQLEFNRALTTADAEAAGTYRKYSRDLETLTGDDEQLATWEENYAPAAPAFQPIPAQPQPWENDHLQFARMLHFIDQAGGFTPALVATLCGWLHCGPEEVGEVLERATLAYEEYGQRPAEARYGRAVGEQKKG